MTMYDLYRYKDKSIADIADLFDTTVDVVEAKKMSEGWDDWREDVNVDKYTALVADLPYPEETSNLIGHLYFIRDMLAAIVEVMPTADRATTLNKVETQLLKFTKKHIDTKHLLPITPTEARKRNVSWLKEFEVYLNSITIEGVIDED